MREINKRIRKGAMPWLVIGLATICSAVLAFLCKDGLFYFRYYTTKDDVCMANSYELVEDAFYTIHNPLIYGQYASNDEGNYYITSIADGKYIGVYMYGSVSEELDLLQNTDISGRGYICNMRTVERRFFQEWFEEAGADNAVLEQLCYRTLVIVPEHMMQREYAAIIALCKVGSAIGIVLIFIYLTGIYRLRYVYSMRKLHITRANLKDDMVNAKHRKELSVGRKYTIIYNILPVVLSNQNLLWIYASSEEIDNYRVRAMTNDGKIHRVYLIDDNKRQYKVSVPSAIEGNQLMDLIATRAPQVLRGYSRERNRLFETDFEGLKRLVEERRYEYQYVTHDVTRQDKINRVLAALDKDDE